MSILPPKIKSGVNSAKLHFNNTISTIYESAFVPSHGDCSYFPKGIESIGILLKGKSLEQIPKHAHQFDSCYLVNNFDKEIEVIGDCLAGKKCVHFVNRLNTAYMKPENYHKLSITDVQLPKASSFADRALKRVIRHYKSLNLRTHFLPKQLLKFNRQDFGKEYAKKYPNTGILAIIYTLEILRPRKMWIAGLDYYQSDYLFRRSHCNPIEVQREKMKRTNLVEVTAKIFSRYPTTEIKMISYYNAFPSLPNVNLISNKTDKSVIT